MLNIFCLCNKNFAQGRKTKAHLIISEQAGGSIGIRFIHNVPFVLCRIQGAITYVIHNSAGKSKSDSRRLER